MISFTRCWVQSFKLLTFRKHLMNVITHVLDNNMRRLTCARAIRSGWDLFFKLSRFTDRFVASGESHCNGMYGIFVPFSSCSSSALCHRATPHQPTLSRIPGSRPRFQSFLVSLGRQVRFASRESSLLFWIFEKSTIRISSFKLNKIFGKKIWRIRKLFKIKLAVKRNKFYNKNYWNAWYRFIIEITIRQRSSSRGIGKSSSDSEVAHGKGKGKGRRGKTKERWPFREGLTVDELARYRRRRVQDRPKDNLQPYAEFPVQNPASEYRHAFGVNVVEFSKVSIRYQLCSSQESFC